MPLSPQFVFIAAGTKGDLHPFMSLALAWQRRGRPVTMIATAFHAEAIERAGLPFVPLGTVQDYLDAVANPDIWNPRKGLRVLLADYGQRMLRLNETLSAMARERPCVVIAHPLALPATALARETGAPVQTVAAFLAPGNLRSCHDPMMVGPLRMPRWVPMSWRRALWRRIDRRFVDPVAVPEINQARGALGLPPVRSFIGQLARAPQLSVTLFPSWFANPPDWPPLLHGDFQLFEPSAGEPLPAELEAFLREGDAPIVFTPGTGNAHARDYFAAALRAVQRLGRRAVLLTSHREQVPASLPPSAIWLPYIPLRELLPRVAALVQHGGIGTTAEALRAGVPQLVVPFAWDQFDNGARVQALGVGDMLPAKRLDASKLERKLRTLLSEPRFRANGASVARRFEQRMDADRLCAEIEKALGLA